MNLILASVSARKNNAKNSAAETLTRDYVGRATRLVPCETAIFDSEARLLAATERQPGRPAAQLILFDSRGDTLTSEEFAAAIARLRDTGSQRILFGIGPADGWSATARAAARHIVSFGRITLPHELARAVAAEQIYRALTILAGHPYHSGH